MFKCSYIDFEQDIWCDTLWQAKSVLQSAMLKMDFTDYETAYIMEYNSVGRNINQYFFSKTGITPHWVKTKIKATHWNSYSDAKQPYKEIARSFLIMFGHLKGDELAFDKIGRKLKKEKV